MSVRLVKIIDPTAIVVGGLVPKGAYSGGTAYSVGDSVSYNGSSYVCITASTGNLPTDTAYWQLVASKGDTGATGPAGTTDYNELDNLPTLGTAAAKDIPATGNASATEVVYGTDTRLTDSRPASDVSAWAKAPTKPTYTKSEVGLSNVNDTSDANKPISTATQTALDTKATTTALDAHANSTANPHNVTKAQVGLGNVQNLAPADMPVSTDTQTALNAKANASDTVNLTGDQTVAGVKTFSSSPVVPTATTSTQAVNKAQMDTADAGKQNADATLTALAAYNTNGILTQTAADTFTGRTITGTANQVNVTDGDGVSGNPTLSLPQNIHTGATPTFAGGTLNGSMTVTGTAAANVITLKNSGGINVTEVTSSGRLLVKVNGLALALGDSTNTSCYFDINGRALFGLNATTGNAFMQGLTGKGIEFAVNNATAYAGTVAKFDTSGNFQPTTDSTYTIGTSYLYWKETYTNKLFLNSTATLDGSTAGQLSATGNMVITPTAATDQPAFSAEFLPSTGWTSTGWTGDFATGWTHTVGNTTALSQSKAAVINTAYQITYTVTGRTAGSFSLAFGGQSQSSITATGSFGPKATTVAGLVITPTSDFDGTIVVSIKSLTAGSTAAFVLKDSGGANRIEMRGTNATSNTFIGDDSGMYNTTGYFNSAIGSSSLRSNTTGYFNSAIGTASLYSNTTGTFNSAVGRESLYSNTTGYSNSAIGTASLRSNTTGYYNSAIGTASLYSNTTGTYNLAIGTASLHSNTTGTFNSAIGHNSGRYIADGSTANAAGNNSVFLGTNTKAQADAQTNQTVIGHNAIGNGSNTVTIGNSSVTGNFFSGNIESTTVSGGVVLKSPDGTRYKLTIANGGTVTVSAA